ncbi:MULTISPECIES: hypothetical protein [Chryseobacterium]|uniref:hypothetical protein n=1 Tax=Chryseobacterium TaxID=59732 RepID=UPI00162A9C27|nr:MULTISPECIES: hypothetical protein [Chryseobacterium]MDM1555974.1 hypothetical protein [Chryseobacterium indologenes]
MKKIVYLSVLLCVMYVSGQKTYQQYKQEREYSQRYANEQRQQFYKDVELAISKYNTLVNQYVALVKKHKSTSYVYNNFPKIGKPMFDIQYKIQANWNNITYDQSKRFDEIRHKYLVVLDDYGD